MPIDAQVCLNKRISPDILEHAFGLRTEIEAGLSEVFPSKVAVDTSVAGDPLEAIPAIPRHRHTLVKVASCDIFACRETPCSSGLAETN